jgi:hypothetical protein
MTLEENIKTYLNNCTEEYCLENLPEKIRFEYIDNYGFHKNKSNTLFNKIAKDLTEKVYNFEIIRDNDSHPSFVCDEVLSKELGATSIEVYSYKWPEYPGVHSNYIIFGKSIMIDLYIVEFDKKNLKNSIYNAILKELYNIGRDTEWVNNGTYNEEMEKMKQEEIAFRKSLDELENKRLFSDEEYNKFMKKLNL